METPPQDDKSPRHSTSSCRCFLSRNEGGGGGRGDQLMMKKASSSSVEGEWETPEEQQEQDSHQTAEFCKVINGVRELCDMGLLRPRISGL